MQVYELLACTWLSSPSRSCNSLEGRARGMRRESLGQGHQFCLLVTRIFFYHTLLSCGQWKDLQKEQTYNALSYLEENLRDYWYCKTLKDKNLDYTLNNKVI